MLLKEVSRKPPRQLDRGRPSEAVTLSGIAVIFVVNPLHLSRSIKQDRQFGAFGCCDDVIGIAVMNLDWRQVADIVSQTAGQRKNWGEEFDNGADCYACPVLRPTQGEVTASQLIEMPRRPASRRGAPRKRRPPPALTAIGDRRRGSWIDFEVPSSLISPRPRPQQR